MASWDYPAVSAPRSASYGAPLVDFSKIDNLQKRYYEGANIQREQDKANLFRNGIPREGGLPGAEGPTSVGGAPVNDPNAPIDFNKVTDQAARVGGYDYAKSLIDMQMAGQIGQGASNVISPGGGSAPQAAQPTAYGQPKPMPRAVTPLPASAPGGPQGDQSGSVMSMVPDGLPPEATGKIASDVANAFKLDPNAAVPPELVPRIKAKIASLTGVPVPQAPPAAAPAPAPQQVAQAAPSTAPAVSEADRLDGEATYIRAQAARAAAVNPKVAEVLNKEADTRADKAKQLRDQSADAPAIKEWRQSGSKLPYDEWVAQAEGSKETAKEDAKSYSKKYEVLVDNGQKAQVEIPQLELMQKEMDDPNFFSGAGEKYNLLYKRLKSAVGIDPEASVPQEMLRKITSNNILSSLGALKGLGQIRVAEINLAKDAAASPDNSVPANKFLVETSKRVHQRNAEIADLAQAYKEENGALDAGFDKKVTKFYKTHPLFNDAEIKDWHRIIGAPAKEEKPAAQPASGGKLPTFASPSAVAAANLPKGTRFLDGNGVERMVP